MKLLILLFLLTLSFSPAANAADLTLLNQLPAKITAAKAKAHKGWDTGNTGEMREASYQYNNTLLATINGLAKAYYPANAISPEGFTEYLKALYSTRRFKETIGNPSGEFQGTMSYLDVPNDVSGDLESTIADMVQALAKEHPDFKYKDWKKKWQQAIKP